MPVMRLLMLYLALCCLVVSSVQSQDDPPQVRIGVLFDGPGELNGNVLTTVRDEIGQLLSDEYAVLFPDAATITADWSVASIDHALDVLLDDPAVDLVITLGAIGTYQVSHRGALPKPVIGPFAIDIDWQALPFSGPGSGVTNLNYLVSLPDFRRGLASLERIHRSHVVAVLIFQPYYDAFPIKQQHVELTEREYDCNLIHIPVGYSAVSAMDVLPDSAEAAYVTPLVFGWNPNEIAALADSLIARGLPSFSYIGRNEVELGILAGLGPRTDWTRLARRVALNVQRILEGENPGDLPVDFSLESQLVINMQTAREIGIYPNWDVMTEAELISERSMDDVRRVTLMGAVRDALRVNLDLLADESGLSSGSEDINASRAGLLPQAEASAAYRLIDKDRAGGIAGVPEGELLGSLQFSQLLFSDRAWAGVTIEKKLQAQREYAHDALRLDVILSTAVAYVDVLRAQTVEQIRKNNLQLSRENLELAHLRERIGQSGPGEGYRWESQIATNRQDVVQASANRNVAEIQLNRLLRKPAEDRFQVADQDVKESVMLIDDPRLKPYTDDKWSFAVFRSFMTEIGLELAPETKQLTALIEAQERLRSSARRSFFLPSLGASASFDYVLSRHGEGSGEESVLTDLLPPGTSLPAKDDLSWSIGVKASLPLFQGGRRFAEVNKAGFEIQRLSYEQAALRDRIEQNIRSALHRYGAAYATVGFSRAAAEAAARNLELVTDAYSRGRANILDLLDAQNASLVADLVAANAGYDHIVSYLQVQRAIGRFDFFLDERERSELFQRMARFFEAARADR